LKPKTTKPDTGHTIECPKLSSYQAEGYRLSAKEQIALNEELYAAMETRGERLTFTMSRAEAEALYSTVVMVRNNGFRGDMTLSPFQMALTNGALEKMAEVQL